MERPLWQKRFDKPRVARIAHYAVVLLGILATSLSTYGVTLTASLERDTITMGESVGLSVTFEGAQPQGTPSIAGIANLQIVYNGPSSQFSFVNGQTTSSITHNFTVTPRQPGSYTIPALTIDLGGQKLTTQPLRLTVLKPNAPPPDAVAAGTQPAFLRLQLPKTNVYFGEVLMGEYQLYLRDGIVGVNQFQFTGTPTEGLSAGKFVEGQKRRVQIGNTAYTVVPLYFPLTPIKTGPLSMGPVTANVVIELPSSNRRRDVFDPFGMFGNERRQVALTTDAVNLQCMPLPEQNKPADFNGAVGNYTMSVSVGPTNVATGDPITVRVEITGRGALDALKLPEQAAWRGFKSYPPTANVELSDQLGLQGKKTFEQIISPETTDTKELPPFTFSFFDPDTAEYRTLTQPATRLLVRPGGNVPLPTIAASPRSSGDTSPPPQQDIVPIKTRLGSVTRPNSSAGTRKVFLALNVIPMLAFIGAVVWRKRTDAFANNPRLRRQRQVATIIEAGLKRLQSLAAQNNSDEFFAELVHLLQEKLGERLNCPASSITEAVIDEKLRPRGLPDSTLEELHALFQSCNLARYAPVKSSEELASIIPRLEAALKKLEEVKT